MKDQMMILLAMAMVAFSGCKKDNEDELVETEPIVSSGMIVACEGSFGQNNASVHWIGDDGSSSGNVYQASNGGSPGDVLQGFRSFNDRHYLVVNNSQKVEVVSQSNFNSMATISGCDYPRDVYLVNAQKGYISNGSLEGELLIFNPSSNTISGSIEVGFGPEQITSNNSFVFVANSGGWAEDNTVSVVNPSNDQVVNTVEVGDRPTAIASDYQGNIWVLCSGAVEYDENWNVINETDAQLIRVDGASHVVTASVNVGEIGEHPTFMHINQEKNKLYIVNDELLVFDVNLGDWQTSPVAGEGFSSVAVHPATGEIYLGSSPDYVSNDDIFVYDASGSLTRTIEVGVAPKAIVFKE